MSNAVEEYKNRIFDMYVKTHPNVNQDKVRALIDKLTDETIRDIPCQLHNNVYHEVIDTTVLNTFNWIEERQPIISGNGTFFKQHEEYVSPAIKMLEKVQKKRKEKQKLMYTFQPNTIEYTNLNVGQNKIKVVMNADYGAAGSPLSPFYSVYIPPSTTGTAKNIITALICCLEFISGNTNKWCQFTGINELFDMIHIVLSTDDSDRELINDKYSPEEVSQYLISRIGNKITSEDLDVIKRFCKSLSDKDLTKLMLAFNSKLVLSKYLSNDMKTITNYLSNNQLDLSNISEESLQVSGFGLTAPDEILENINRVKKIVMDNCVYSFIFNDVEVRATNMQRTIVCVTDTDSLMVFFASYIEAFNIDTPNFRDACLIAAAIGMRLFVEGIIPKYVKIIASGMNIKDEYYSSKFVFKNEFGFLCMALFAKKMYAAAKFYQEGKPRDIHDVAVTGLSFKKRDSAEFLEPIMNRLYDQYILSAEKINVGSILDEFYQLRDQISNDITNDTSYFKVLSVKDISAYAKSKTLPLQIRGSILWNNLMPDEEILPMDRVVVIPLSYDKIAQNKHIPFVNEMERILLINNENKKIDPYICLPEHYHTIPDWIKCCIDVEYTIDNLLKPFKQILGLFDTNMADTRGGMIPSRMIYI